ncbi:hypothetical protein HPB47_003988, partial [Ixodes persulcatus]
RESQRPRDEYGPPWYGRRRARTATASGPSDEYGVRTVVEYATGSAEWARRDAAPSWGPERSSEDERTYAGLGCLNVLLFRVMPPFVVPDADSTRSRELQSNPVLLFQCYRNGTTPDRELSVNYTSLFDGTEPNNGNATVTLWFAINGTEDQVYKFTFDASYVPETDSITFAYGGRRAEVVLTEDPINGTVYVINETFNGTVFHQIYQTDESCGMARAVLQQQCPDRCGMKQTRIF